VPAFRRVQKVLTSVRVVENDGFVYRRALPHAELKHVDPLLQLDEVGPLDLAPGQRAPTVTVPRRGFHHLTYILDGEMEVSDSRGHAARLRRGDVQVQSLGTGLVATESSSAHLHAVQIWFNQSRVDKATQPRTTEVRSSDLPIGFVGNADGGPSRGQVRLVAGEALELKSPTPFPGFVLHVSLEPRGIFSYRLPRKTTALAYVLEGAGSVDERKVARAGQLVWFDTDGDAVHIENPQQSINTLECLVVGGAPLGDLVRQHGSLVAASDEELILAVNDLAAGKIV